MHNDILRWCVIAQYRWHDSEICVSLIGGVIMIRKLKYTEKTLPQWHFIHHISYMDWPEICDGQSLRNIESLYSCLVSESMWNYIIAKLFSVRVYVKLYYNTGKT
jgi:hypothetical protein